MVLHPRPLPIGVSLGTTVKVSTPLGFVVGVLVGVYRPNPSVVQHVDDFVVLAVQS